MEAGGLRGVPPDPLSSATKTPTAGEAVRRPRSASAATLSDSQQLAAAGHSLEMAHVVFMDIVGYSLFPTDYQPQLIAQLREAIQASPTFREAQSRDELISLPAGDGVVLVFFRDPIAPVRCATEISRILSQVSVLKLRIGIHSGPVYRIADINAQRNVAGGGINMAQRTMECGDAGHILLSQSTADVLREFGDWAPHLQDLGEHQVKHGVRLRLYNLCTPEVGNPTITEKLCSTRVDPQIVAMLQSIPAPAPAKKKKVGKIAAAVSVAASVVLGAALWFATRTQPSAALPAPPPERQYNYSILVQKFRNQRPWGESFALAGEMIFAAEDRIRFVVNSAAPGHFYLLNEGPAQAAGLPSFHALFPGEEESSLVQAGQTIRVPAEAENWIVFDEQEGTEKVWMVWAAQPVQELEAMRQYGGSQHRGVIDEPGQIHRIQTLLSRHLVATVGAGTEDQTSVRGTGDILVRLISLEHR